MTALILSADLPGAAKMAVCPMAALALARGIPVLHTTTGGSRALEEELEPATTRRSGQPPGAGIAAPVAVGTPLQDPLRVAAAGVEAGGRPASASMSTATRGGTTMAAIAGAASAPVVDFQDPDPGRTRTFPSGRRRRSTRPAAASTPRGSSASRTRAARG